MLIIIDMANTWNQAWVKEGEDDERYLYALLGATVVNYTLIIVFAVLSFRWFAPDNHDCSLNISLITFGLLLCIAISFITFHPTVKEHNQGASLFVAACTALYVSYLGFSALQSEPRDYECNDLGQKIGAASSTTLAMGMVLTLLSTVWAAFRAGSNISTFSTEWSSLLDGHAGGDEELTSSGLDGIDNAPRAVTGMERHGGGNPSGTMATSSDGAGTEFQPVGYNYAQFYIVFALASMYIAMLMTGWGSGALSMDQIDVGWTSVWVKTGSQWAAAGLYAWTCFAPALFPDREFF